MSFVVKLVVKLIGVFITIMDMILYYFLKFSGLGVSVFQPDLRSKESQEGRIPVQGVVYETEQTKKDKKPDETLPYRNVNSIKRGSLMETPVTGVSTLKQLFQWACKSFESKPCMSSRVFLKTTEKKETLPDGAQRSMYIANFKNGLETKSYGEVRRVVENLGSGLAQFSGLNSGDRFAIYENTSEEYFTMLNACIFYNITVVTVYATLGEEALISAFNESKITGLFTNKASLSKVLKFKEKCSNLKYVVYNERELNPASYEAMNPVDIEPIIKQLEELGMKVISYSDAVKLGESASKAPAVREEPKNDSLMLIMYTSGTTSTPKGVMLTHRNFLSALSGVQNTVNIAKTNAFRMLAYLPLAHIFEFQCEFFMLTNGGTLVYGTPRTLTDKTAYPAGDIETARPTIFTAVPRVYETLKKGIYELINSEKTSVLKRTLFYTAFEAKKRALYSGRDTPIWNFLVFRNLNKKLGGQLKVSISGGAPLAPDTHEFFRICFGCSTCQGYGLTETAAGASIQSSRYGFRKLNVGPPVESIEIKLQSVPEMNYLVTDKNPRGEVCLRGGPVSLGYYEREKENKESYKEDGWFHTGDVGVFDEFGTLSIIDRKKNLVKLQCGEYVAVEKVESVYGNSPFVSPNGMCAYGNGFYNYLVAVVIPQESHLRSYVTKKYPQFKNLSFEDLCKEKQIEKDIFDDMTSCAKKGKLSKNELIGKIRLTPELWTPENEMLTAAMKLKRPNIHKHYQKQINEMYGIKE